MEVELIIHCETCSGGEMRPVGFDGQRFLPSIAEMGLDMTLHHRQFFGHELKRPPLDEFGRFG